jgi:hypothetical protein
MFRNPLAAQVPAGFTAGTNTNNDTVATTAYADRLAYLPTWVGFREDFLHSGAASSITAATGEFFDTNWSAGPIGAGTSTQVIATSTWNNPGQIIITTPATLNVGAAIYKSSTGGAFGPIAANAGWEANIIVKLNQTTNVCLRIGFFQGGQQVADAPSAGMFISYDTAAADANFIFECRNATTSTRTASSVAADTNFHHFRIWSTVAGTINFSIDGGATTSITTNVPTAQVVEPAWQTIARAAGAVATTIDFFSYAAATTRT